MNRLRRALCRGQVLAGRNRSLQLSGITTLLTWSLAIALPERVRAESPTDSSHESSGDVAPYESPWSPVAKPIVDERQAQAIDAIERKLDQGVNINLDEIPLEAVFDYLSAQYEMPILIDREGLQAEGIPPDTPISFRLQGVKLRTALRWMLRPLDLNWTIRHEALWITSRERVDAAFVPRAFKGRSKSDRLPSLQSDLA